MSDRELTQVGSLISGIVETITKKSETAPALPDTIPAGAFDDLIRPEDVGYTHPVFLQCFMPVRHKRNNLQRWQANCGKASLVIRAGELIDPDRQNHFEQCHVPAGPKARLITAYINDFIYRKKTRIVPLGQSMRDGMEKMGIAIGGPNGDELMRELKNFAAAEIVLGMWGPDGAKQRKADVTSEFSFWLERNPDQRVFWQPEMTISEEYYKAIHEREMTPFAWPALLELSHNARAMDIHAFLAYRLHKGLARPVHLSRQVLHGMFGQGIKDERSHWQQFKAALTLAHTQYRTARVEIAKDARGNETGLILKNSPPLIPHRKMPRLS